MYKKNQPKNGTTNCAINIKIDNSGTINIYNCSKTPKSGGCNCKDDHGDDIITDKKCIPVSRGAKPKQSQQHKLNRLLNKNTVPNSLAASFIQATRRFVAGKPAGSALETKMFTRFGTLSPEMKKILKCISQSYDSLSPSHQKLFASSILQDINIPVDAENLTQAFEHEITSLVSGLALEDTKLEERPGKPRLFPIPLGVEWFESQVKIFKINDLRTNDNKPQLQAHEYLPEEIQQICTPNIVNGSAEWNCSMQQPPCDGHQVGNACMRVHQVQSGTSVTLEGVNFFDINAKVQYRLKNSTDNFREIDAFVYGDIDTPVTEIINGQKNIIADSRVHDKIFFTIPTDTTSGIYEFMIVVPNPSGIAGLADKLSSSPQFLEVVPPVTARFQIASERLWARKETAPQWPGSDEVGIRVLAIPIYTLADGKLEARPEDPIPFRFNNMDSQDTRVMDSVLFSQSAPIAGVIISVMGYEIDGEDAYKNQITEWTDIFIELVKDQLTYIVSSTFGIAVLKKLIGFGFWSYVLIAIGAALLTAVDLFIALWAPADLIIQDIIQLSVTDIARLTNINIPAPIADSDKTINITPGDIDIRLMESSKSQYEYKEERGYLSEDEDSWYNIRFRYNQIS